MRTYLFCLGLLLAMTGYAQKTVAITFNPASTGDYDLKIQHALEANGYQAVIDYGTSQTTADFTLTYDDQSVTNPHQLSAYQLVLHDPTGRVVNQVNKKIRSMGFKVKETKQLCLGLSNLFEEDFNCELTDSKKYNHFNIGFTVQKLDSAQYAIIAWGAGVTSSAGLEKAFLKKAHQFMNHFAYYFEEGEYQYSAPAPGINTHHNAKALFGVIQPTDTAVQSDVHLVEKPIVFRQAFEE